MRRRFSTAVLILLLVAAPSYAQSADHPPTIALDGARSLPLVAHARRLHLVGTLEIYTLAVYSDRPIADLTGLVSADAPKALRIQVSYEEDVRRRLALDWRRELVPHLEPAAMAHLQGALAPVQKGDVVTIEYVPAKGTVVRVNRGVAVSGAHHDLMLAFLDHWLGQRPVSEEIKQALLASS